MSIESITVQPANEVEIVINPWDQYGDLSDVMLKDDAEGFESIEGTARPFEAIKQNVLSRVIGHEAAVDDILGEFTSRGVQVTNNKYPAASFAFVGAPGSGKKKTAEVLGETFGDGSGDNIAIVNSAEYLHSESVTSLMSSLVGHIAKNAQTEVQDGLPKTIIYFDNIDRGSPELQKLVHRIINGGMFVVKDGTVVDFSDTMVVVSKDVDASELTSFGFKGSPLNGNISNAASVRHFEAMAGIDFCRRINKTIVFQPLSSEQLGQVFDRQLYDINDQYEANYGICLSLGDTARARLIEETQKQRPNLGAYTMMSVFNDLIQKQLGAHMLEGNISAGMQVRVTANDNGFGFAIKQDTELLRAVFSNEELDEDGFPLNVYPGIE